MATAVEILTEARRLIAEKGWCQGYYARTVTGMKCEPQDKHATAFCSEGAIMLALDDGDDEYKSFGFLKQACPQSDDINLNRTVAFNDAPERTKDEVLAAFDRAIEFAKAAS